MSKYASLPDIDVSGADVFETPDLPPQHSYLGDSDSEDEYLNRTTTAGASSSSSPKTRRQATGAKQQTRDDAAYVNEDRLDAHEARDRFKRVVHLERQTGARAARRDLPLGRRTLPATPEYVVQGGDVENRERESPLERLRRLRSEIAELEDEVERDETARAEGDAPDRDDDESDAREDKTGQHDDADDKGHKAKGTTTKRQVSPAVILQQLHLLRGDLDGIRPTVEKMAAGDRARTARDGRGEFGARAKASSELLTKLAQDRQGEPPHLVQPSSSSSPPSNGVAKDARIATREGELESRVAQLERMIGANEADLDDTTAHPVPLAPTVSRLDHLLTLLTQPRHLDSISRRVKVLTSDLERIHESRRKLGDTRPLTVALQGGVMTLSTTGGSTTAHATSSGPGTSSTTTTTMGIPPDALQKIDALFGLLARIDPLVPLAPRLLARLRSLQALHESSTTFATALQGAEGELAALGERRAGLDQVLASLEETFRANEHKFETNLKALEHRLEGVGKRLDDLNQ